MKRITLSYHWLKLSIGALTTLLAGACAYQAPKDVKSPYYYAPVGSSVEIRKPVEVPEGFTRVYLQNGRIVGKINRFVPNCNLEVRKIDWEKTQRVETGTYRISKVQRTLEEVVEARPIRVASVGPLLASLADDGGSTSYYKGYHLYLEGPDPNVMRVSCRGVYGEPHQTYPPSISEIRQAMGDLISLHIVEEG